MSIKKLQTVILEKKGRIGVITMNRPERRNALNDQLLDDVYDSIRELEEDETVRVIILKGAGKAFCAGYDLSPREKPFTTVEDWRRHAFQGNRMNLSIWNCRKPVIAQIHGFALGGGCDLAMVADFTYAAAGCMIGEPEIQFNSAPPFGNIMTDLIGMKKVKQLLLTGERISAADAESIGLITKCVPDDKLEEEVWALANKISKLPVPAVELNKCCINRAYENKGLLQSIHVNEEMFAEIQMSPTPEAEKFFSIANKDGLAAAFKWRDAYFAAQDAAED